MLFWCQSSCQVLGPCKFLAIILAIILLLGYHPGHHPGHPAIILAIILVYPSFILPDYAIILPGRMIGPNKSSNI